MDNDFRLPSGYEISPGIRISRLKYTGEEWQIYQTGRSEDCLLVEPTLVTKWVEIGLLTMELFTPVCFDSTELLFVTCDNQYQLAPLEKTDGPNSKTDAMVFASSLRETRKIDKNSPLQDALYVEKFSRLLPTWAITARIDDDVILGTWLTGGVAISVLSFRRLCVLMGWLHPVHIREILLLAGYEVPEVIVNGTKKGKKIEDCSEGQFRLPGRLHLEKFFNEHVIDIILNSNRYEALGITFPSAIVLHGPTGCGKTFAVERLVEFLEWPSFSVNSNTIGSPYIHETSKKISETFDKAFDSAPSVFIIDEMESFLSARASAGSSNIHHVEEVAEFLRRIPEAVSSKVLIIGMTNLLDMIDPAIIRRGRFDHIIEVGMPGREEVSDLIHSILRGLPTEDDLDVTPLLDKLTGKPLSDIAFVLREAARLAARDGKSRLDQGSLLKAMGEIPLQNNKESRKIGFNIM